MMIAWTDMPLCRSTQVWGPVLDPPDKLAPIRKVKVLSYDGNKYAQIQFLDGIYEIKVGYLYSEPGRCGEVSPIKPSDIDSGPSRH